MEENKANSEVAKVEDTKEVNPQENNEGTQEKETQNPTVENVASTVDYSKKFSESSKEAQRLFEENKKLKKELELKDTVVDNSQQQNIDNLYPGFEDLDQEAKESLIAYTDSVTKRAAENLKKDPAYAFAQKQYHENRWNAALESTIKKFPELAKSKDEFKSKYFNPSNVPENIEEVLEGVAKIHLFDQAKEIGAKEAQEKNKQVELERTTAGTKVDSSVKRTLDDWMHMQAENPEKFRKLSKEFNEAMKSGKI